MLLILIYLNLDIDQLFVFIKDPADPNKKLIVINPKRINCTTTYGSYSSNTSCY